MFKTDQLKSLFYSLRETIWNYPGTLFFDENSLSKYFTGFYFKTRPFSHFVSSIFIFLIISSIILVDVNAFLRINSTQYIEGTVVGVDENGDLLGLKKINPLVPTTIQLEKDISELIYEGLVKVGQNGEVKNELIESYTEIKVGNHYRFVLRSNIKWHDGVNLTSEDVRATFELLRKLAKRPETTSNFASVVANQMSDVKIIDERTFEFMLKSEEAVLPTFFESISFKILPAHFLTDVDEDSIMKSTPKINTFPIGTGPFKFLDASGERIRLTANESFHAGKPKLEEIVFKLFENEENAITALESGQVHALAGVSTESLEKTAYLKNITYHKSNIVYSQYWGVYFNLDTRRGNSILQDKEIRKAISHAIDREKIVRAVGQQGSEAIDTIPPNSFAHASNIARIGYNPEEANRLLDTEGWVLNPSTGFREKEGSRFEFSMVYVDNFDRRRVAEAIRQNLETVGIEIKLVPDTIENVNNEYIYPRSFDMLLYGQITFIDPDRYELFHSSQIGFPQQGGGEQSTGLNISSYISEQTDSKIENQQIVKIPKTDILLESGRTFINKEKRKEGYEEFQKVLADEVPVIFLYHPIYTYIVNNRVEGITMEDIGHLEERFDTVTNWSIDI